MTAEYLHHSGLCKVTPEVRPQQDFFHGQNIVSEIRRRFKRSSLVAKIPCDKHCNGHRKRHTRVQNLHVEIFVADKHQIFSCFVRPEGLWKLVGACASIFICMCALEMFVQFEICFVVSKLAETTFFVESNFAKFLFQTGQNQRVVPSYDVGEQRPAWRSHDEREGEPGASGGRATGGDTRTVAIRWVYIYFSRYFTKSVLKVNAPPTQGALQKFFPFLGWARLKVKLA